MVVVVVFAFVPIFNLDCIFRQYLQIMWIMAYLDRRPFHPRSSVSYRIDVFPVKGALVLQ